MTDTEHAPQVTWKGRLVALLIGLVFSAGIAEFAVRIVNPHWDEYFSGWFMQKTFVPGHGSVRIGKPGFDGHFAQNNGDFRVRIQINADGLRNPEPAAAADGQVWVVGDSMAFGWGVERDEAYSEVLEGLLRRPVYNVASPGANVCGYQRLAARMPDGAKPTAVVVGLILENDIADYDCATESTERVAPEEAISTGLPSVSDVKQYLTKYSALYNFFAVSLKRIDVVNELLMTVGIVKRSHTIRMAVPDDAIDAWTAATAKELATLRKQFDPGVPFVVLVAPTRFEMRDGLASRKALRTAMHAALNAAGIASIDPFDAFMAHGYFDVHFAHDGHWKADGHAIAARAVADWFKEHAQ